jgi:SAM-dependent methyltransferase
MDTSLKIYEELYFDKVSNKTLLRQLHNPIREYENELIEGAIVDIGCGQSHFLVDFASTERDLIAIDNEQSQLDFLKTRLEQESPEKKNKWSFLNQNFPKDGIPEKDYSLIILSNLLHFFTLPECVKIGELIRQKSSTGTLIYIAVHSEKYYTNNPKNPNNDEYFKHYFTIADLKKVFPAHHFAGLYFADIEKTYPKFESDLINDWLDICLEMEGIEDPKVIKKEKEFYLKDKGQSDIIAIFRRK